MHNIYKLKDMLVEELNEIGEKGELSAGTLDTVDKLAHSIKNLCKVIDECEDGYSSRGGMRGGSYEGSYEGSYARGRRYGRRGGANQYGSYAGGYSRAGEDMVSRIQGLMDEAPNDSIRQELQRLMTKVQNA